MADRTELYLLRHAHAGDPEAWSGDDALRPLSAKGEAQAERLGAFLAGVSFGPDAIVTSPKVRAAETARIVAGHLDMTVSEDPRLGGGALAIYLDGEPVVDVWTGWQDRRGRRHWNADTGAMVFSATKGAASTVIHRLADRGLIDYDAPVA